MSNRLRLWIPTIAIILVFTFSLWGLWIWNDQRALNDPYRVQKLLNKGYVIKAAYPNGTLIMERRLPDGTIKRKTLKHSSSSLISPKSTKVKITTTTRSRNPQTKVTVTKHSYKGGSKHRYERTHPRQSRVGKFFNDVKNVFSGASHHKHDTVVGTTMVGNKKITCKVNCETKLVKKPASKILHHSACVACCHDCCCRQGVASSKTSGCHCPPIHKSTLKKNKRCDCKTQHGAPSHHGQGKQSSKSHSLAHPVVKVRVYHQNGLKVRVFKHKYKDLHGNAHTVEVHSSKDHHPTHIRHQLSLHQHKMKHNNTYMPIIKTKTGHHMHVPPHIGKQNEYYFKGMSNVKSLGLRKYNGKQYKCWGNVPQKVAFSPQYYGLHKDVLIEVPKDKHGHKLPVTPKSMVTFCVHANKI